eukprot:5180858-Pyramimonas_sp.AAC.1
MCIRDSFQDVLRVKDDAGVGWCILFSPALQGKQRTMYTPGSRMHQDRRSGAHSNAGPAEAS